MWAFEEETVISDLTLHGALIYLGHSPKLQSELQVQLENPGIGGASNSPLRLRGYVVLRLLTLQLTSGQRYAEEWLSLR